MRDLRDPGKPVALDEQKRSRDGAKFCSIPPSYFFVLPVYVSGDEL